MIMTTDDDVLLTRKEACALLKVSPSTLSRWATQGYGPPVIWLTPHSSRYLRSDVDAFLQRNRSEGSA